MHVLNLCVAVLNTDQLIIMHIMSWYNDFHWHEGAQIHILINDIVMHCL